MTTAALRTAAPQPLLSVRARSAAAAAVLIAVALAWNTTGQASHQAVDSAAASFSRNTTYVTLPPVEIVVRREQAPTKGDRAV